MMLMERTWIQDDKDGPPSSQSPPVHSLSNRRKRLAENAESNSPVKANKKLKQTTLEDEDGARYFGDQWEDDDSVPIPIPVKTFRSNKAILNGSGIGGLQAGGQGSRKRKITTPSAGHHQSSLRQKQRPRQPPLFSSRQAPVGELEREGIDETPSKRQKRTANTDMSREDPIVLDDDESVQLSSTSLKHRTSGERGHFQNLFQRTSPRDTRSLTREIPVYEYNDVEAFMNPRRALRPQSREQQSDDIFSVAAEEQSMTAVATQRRRGAEDTPRSHRPTRTSVAADVEANQVRSSFTATDGKQRNSRLGSPDVLQGDVTTGRVQSPSANSSTLARRSNNRRRESNPHHDTTNRPKRARGPIIHHMMHADITIPDNEDFMLSLEKEKMVIWSLGSRLSQESIWSFRLESIIHMHWAGLYFKLGLRSPPAKSRIAFFELHTEKEVQDLAHELERIAPSIKVLEKDEGWMRRAWGAHDTQRDRERALNMEASQAEIDAILAQTNNGLQHRSPISRRKSGDVVAKSDDDECSKSTRTWKGVGETFQEIFDSSRVPKEKPPSEESEIPGKRAQQTRDDTAVQSPRRTTRASTNNSTTHVEKNDLREVRDVPFSRTGGLGREWKRPLTYPKTGKKRAEVEFRDLERLDDNEFLNDNLIEFFLRFLEADLQQHRPELAKKIYFFNTYFFATLTNTARTKKGINYEGVQKWTRGTNLFEHDFVVVPINENAHWYVAIVCNLPKLLPGSEDLTEDQAVNETQKCSPPPELLQQAEPTHVVERVEDLSQTPSIMELPPLQTSAEDKLDETDRSFRDLNIADPDANPDVTPDLNATGSLLSKWAEKGDSKGRTGTQGSLRRPGKNKKAARRSGVGLQRYDVKAPMIITMDSLGLGRSPTSTALRGYVVEEAKAKLDLDIDGQQIRGMTAKGIPNQENFSDCGLFLLAYMEKFILDPYGFVGSILNRKMDEHEDWPAMESHDLRNRLRSFLLAFHEAQENGNSVPTGTPIGRILLGEPRRQSPFDVEARPTESGTTSKYFNHSSSPQITKVQPSRNEAEDHTAKDATSQNPSINTQQDPVITVDSETSSLLPDKIPRVLINQTNTDRASPDGFESMFESNTDGEGRASHLKRGQVSGQDYLGDEVPESEQEGEAESSFDELLPASARQP